MGPVRI